MSNIYMQNILDHFHDPENYGELEGADKHVVEYNPLCGDKIEVYLNIENEIIKAAQFTGEGCAISQATMSMLSSEIIGKNVTEVRLLGKDFIVDMLGIELSPTRLKCALLSLQAVHNALN
jgi:nitrogen fixation NifU-like protein